MDPKLARGVGDRAAGGGDLAELAELALREWGIGLDEFWDDTPNLDAERGLTIPRLHDLVDAYERRYHRQLRDVSVATAIAHHDPKGLDKAFPPLASQDGQRESRQGREMVVIRGATCRDIVLRITGEADEAVATFQRVLNESRKLDGTTATATSRSTRSTSIRRSRGAKKESAGLRTHVRGRRSFDLDIAKVQAKIEQVKRNLENLGKQAPSAKVDIADRAGARAARTVCKSASTASTVVASRSTSMSTGRCGGGWDRRHRRHRGGDGARRPRSRWRAAPRPRSAPSLPVCSGITRGVPILGGLARGFHRRRASAPAPRASRSSPSCRSSRRCVAQRRRCWSPARSSRSAASFLTAAAGAGVLALALAAMAGPVVLVAIAAMAAAQADPGRRQGVRGAGRRSGRARPRRQRAAAGAATQNLAPSRSGGSRTPPSTPTAPGATRSRRSSTRSAASSAPNSTADQARAQPRQGQRGPGQLPQARAGSPRSRSTTSSRSSPTSTTGRRT